MPLSLKERGERIKKGGEAPSLTLLPLPGGKGVWGMGHIVIKYLFVEIISGTII